MSETEETRRPVFGELDDDAVDQSEAVGVSEKFPFSLYLLEIYLCFVYLRPQYIIPALSPFRLPLILTIILGLLVLPRLQEKLSDRKAVAFGFLLFFLLFHIPLAVNNFYALLVFQEMLLLLVAYLAITQVVDTLPRFRHLMLVWVVIHTVLSIYAITHGGTGPGAFLGDENDLALVLIMALPFPFFFLSSPNPPVRKSFLLLALCVGLGAVFATNSRGGFLGLLAVSLYCLWKTPRKMLSIAVLASCVLIGSLAAPPEYWERINSIIGEATGDVDGTGADRWWTWGVAFEMFKANPVFGVGQGNFAWTIGEYEGSGFRERSFSGRAAHSVYFTLLPELGMLGLLIFVYMLYLFLQDSRALQACARNASAAQEADLADLMSVAHALRASLIGFLVSGAFISALYYPPFWLLLAFSTSVRRIALDIVPTLPEASEAEDVQEGRVDPETELSP